MRIEYEVPRGCGCESCEALNTDVRHPVTPKAPDSAQHSATMTVTGNPWHPYFPNTITPYDPSFPTTIPGHYGTNILGYGGTAIPASDNKQEEIKDAEDKVLAAIENWPKWQKAICYRQLHALGLRMTDVDDLIRRRTK